MRIDPRWAWLLGGRDKVGVGVQGPTDLPELDRFNPSRVLFLAPEFGYADHYGPRAMLRTPHHDKPWWTDPERWAEHGANNLEVVYGQGVRDYQPINEVWGLEGLSDQEHHYQWMGEEWTPRFLNALQVELNRRGIPLHPEPDGVRVWLFAPSPGHNYEDNFVGLRHLAAAFRDPRVCGSVEHYYWQRDQGFFNQPGFDWHIGRMLRVRAKMLELGIDKPVLVGEFNREVRRNDPEDVALYAQQVKRYYHWLNSLDWVIGATIFLWSCGDWATDFYDLTVTRTPGLAAALSDGWDRLSEGEWAEEEPVTPDERQRYYTDLWRRWGGAYNANNAIARRWAEMAAAGEWLGPPVEPEHQTENGQYIYQAFTGGVLHCQVGVWEVRKGLPPLPLG